VWQTCGIYLEKMKSTTIYVDNSELLLKVWYTDLKYSFMWKSNIYLQILCKRELLSNWFTRLDFVILIRWVYMKRGHRIYDKQYCIEE